MAELEKAGVPTVGIVDRTFEKNWQASSKVFGVKVLRKLLVPRPLVGLTAEDVYPYIDAVFEELVKALTEPMAVESVEAVADQSEMITIEGEDRYAALENMNRLFLSRGWGDGFPLWAPTRERVDAMLAGTRKSPSHLVAVLSPGMGLATVEKIAINAVMAGCQPEHLPVLLAAVDAISDPRYMLRNVAMSTGAHAPFMFLNGPDLGTKLVTEQTVSPMVTFNGGLTDEEAVYRGTSDPDPAGGGIARGADPGGLSA